MKSIKIARRVCALAILTALIVGAAGLAAGLQNPVRPSDPDEIERLLGITFDLPEDASDVLYSVVDINGASVIAQATFVRNGANCCHRVMSAPEKTDISGMYYDWTETAPLFIGLTDAEARWIPDGAGVCDWYDATARLMFSVSIESGATRETLYALSSALYTPAEGEYSLFGVAQALGAVAGWQMGTAGSSLKLVIAAAKAADCVEDSDIPAEAMPLYVPRAVHALDADALACLTENFAFVDETAREIVSGDIDPEMLSVSGVQLAYDAYDAEKYDAFSKAVSDCLREFAITP